MRAGDEIVLVGAGEHGVTPIRTYSPAEARALGLIGPEAAAGVRRWQMLEPEVFGKERQARQPPRRTSCAAGR